jgi:hypothetical protein
MKLRILTNRQLEAEKEALKKEHLVRCDLMKLCGRLLSVTRDSRDYIRAHPPSDGKYETATDQGYDDLLIRLNSILERKEWNP